MKVKIAPRWETISVLKLFSNGDTCVGKLTCSECPLFNGVNCELYSKAELITGKKILTLEEVSKLIINEEKKNKLETILKEIEKKNN